jgi:group I intron endonuclease
MPSGIYVIRNEVNGKMYVGSAIDCARRLAKHRYQLRTGTHPSRHLQASFVKHGEAAFATDILEVCETEHLIIREQYWIDRLEPSYNKRLVAESNFGLVGGPEQRAAAREVGRRPETLARISAANKAAWADPTKRAARLESIRKLWTPERRAAMSARQAGAGNTQAACDARWSAPGAKEHASEVHRARHAKNPKRTEADIRALVEASGPWECVSLTGAHAKDRVTVYCKVHETEHTVQVQKLVYEKRGCRACGHQRSSDVQKGRPKRPTDNSEAG